MVSVTRTVFGEKFWSPGHRERRCANNARKKVAPSVVATADGGHDAVWPQPIYSRAACAILGPKMTGDTAPHISQPLLNNNFSRKGKS